MLDDSIQDLFIELWQSKTNTPVQSVRAYFLKALKYKLFRHFRNGQPVQSLDNLEEIASFEISYDHFIISKEDESQRAKKIIDAINRLPARQKEIVYLKIYQGLSYEEISDVMNINYQAARNLFYHSIKSLREMLSSP